MGGPSGLRPSSGCPAVDSRLWRTPKTGPRSLNARSAFRLAAPPRVQVNRRGRTRLERSWVGRSPSVRFRNRQRHVDIARSRRELRSPLEFRSRIRTGRSSLSRGQWTPGSNGSGRCVHLQSVRPSPLDRANPTMDRRCDLRGGNRHRLERRVASSGSWSTGALRDPPRGRLASLVRAAGTRAVRGPPSI